VTLGRSVHLEDLSSTRNHVCRPRLERQLAMLPNRRHKLPPCAEMSQQMRIVEKILG
jgi:hypothetical protein